MTAYLKVAHTLKKVRTLPQEEAAEGSLPKNVKYLVNPLTASTTTTAATCIIFVTWILYNYHYQCNERIRLEKPRKETLT